MATSVAQSPTPILNFLNNAGQMNVGGSLLTQVGGVNYPTFQDAAGAIPLPNPIPLNSRGEISNTSGVSCELYLAQGVAYTLTLKDANGNQIWTANNVTAQGTAATGQMTDEGPFLAGPNFTGSITTNTLTVSVFASGAPLAVGQTLFGAGITVGTTITALGTGTGGAGTYTVSTPQTVGSEAMGAAGALQFAPGFSTSLTLVGFYGSKSNLWVEFDSGSQGPDTLTLNGFILGFNAPIPVGTLEVNVKGGTTATIGTPSTGTITDASVASGTKLFNRINDWVDVNDFPGVDKTGVTDCTAGMQAAHNTGKTVYYPAGNYLVLGTVTQTRGGMIGDGHDQSIITSGSLTADTIVWNGAGEISYTGTLAGPSYEGIGFTQSVAKISGAFIKISPSVGEITFCKFRNLRFSGGFDQLVWNAVSHSVVDSCDFLNVTDISLFVANMNNPDSGDSTVTNCTFNCGIPTGNRTGIHQESSGGLRIINNKFLGFNIQYFMAAAIATNVANLLIANNSFENAVQQAINLLRASGAGNWGSINILCNQFGNFNNTDILTGNATPFLSNVFISGNNFCQLDTAGVGVSLANVNGFSIEGNRFSGSGGTSSGISIAASCSDGAIDNNTFLAVATPYLNASTTTLIDGRQGATLNVTTGSAFGSFFSGTVAVTFPVPYPAGHMPIVEASITPGSANGVTCQVGNVTNTGFNLQAIGFTNGASVPVNWTSQ